jgi:short subunit dehydrogenase-like uncharacterized protein
MPKPWMIYGANGYTGELIAREAARRGLGPVLAGRTATNVEQLAASLSLHSRVFDLGDAAAIARNVEGMTLVLHCAGPFSATAPQMMAACLGAHAHYLDITGEISVFEHARTLDAAARAAGIVICPGVGFDVIPTDCVAAALKATLPDATHLALGFDSRSSFSPGTAKTSVEGLAQGGKVRKGGRIISAAMVVRARHAQRFKWLLGTRVVQNFMKRRIERRSKDPQQPSATRSRRLCGARLRMREVTNAPLGSRRPTDTA